MGGLQAFFTCQLLLTFCKVAVCDSDRRQNVKGYQLKQLFTPVDCFCFIPFSSKIDSFN